MKSFKKIMVIAIIAIFIGAGVATSLGKNSITDEPDLFKQKKDSTNSETENLGGCDCHPHQDYIKLEQTTESNNPLINEINHAIQNKNANWIAKDNPLASLCYEEKANLCGLIDEENMKSSSRSAEIEVPDYLPISFDWRNKNGHNYMTSVKNQLSCGSCWAFGAVGCVEGFIEAYYNDPYFNVDLSEQDLVSCSDAGDCGGGSSSGALDYITNNGIALESCFPYTYSNDNCDNKCDNWEEDAWSIESYLSYSPTIDELKTIIMNYGPVSASLSVYEDFYSYSEGIYEHISGDYVGGHAIVIVGFGQESDRYGNIVNYWICKNSWGSGWGENGYFRIKFYECNIDNSILYIDSVPEPPYSVNVSCSDNDNDGYYYWGVGPKPDYCPSCPDVADCNDSNPNVYYGCGFGFEGNPYIPSNPSPSDEEYYVDINCTLSWFGGDPDNWISNDPIENNTVRYDIYFGKTPNPPLHSTVGPFPALDWDINYNIGILNYSTTYFWKIIAHDNLNNTSESPLWSFSTISYSDHQLDQQYNRTDSSRKTNMWSYAQSFTPSFNILSKISVYVGSQGTPKDNLNIIICDNSLGEPSANNGIVYLEIPPSTIPTDNNWVDLDFNDVYVNLGETYYIILQQSGNSNNYYSWNYSNQNSYRNGRSYQGDNDDWGAGSKINDFAFKTYGLFPPYETGLDQKQTVFDGGTTVYKTKQVAQSFAPSADMLTKAKLYVKRTGTPNDITVSIKNSLTGYPLTKITLPYYKIFPVYDYITFDFPDIPIKEGYYYIVVNTSGGDSNNCYYIGHAEKDVYTNGMVYIYTRDEWVPNNRLDLCFKTHEPENPTNLPPYKPHNPVPEDYQENVNVNPTLNWSGGDPNSGDTVVYDVYFGSSYGAPLVASNVTSPTYKPSVLECCKTYYWRVIARDNLGAESYSVFWEFTTQGPVEPNLDQYQIIFDEGMQIVNKDGRNIGAAQSFVPTVEEITKVKIYTRLHNSPSFDLTVQLREENPTGNLLEEQVFPPSEVNSSWDWLEVNFDDITVVPGSTYVIVAPPPPETAPLNTGYEWGYADWNEYLNGHCFYTVNGIEWHEDDSYKDYCFKTYGYVNTTPNEPPIANEDLYNGSEDTSITVPAPGVLHNDIDLDNDTLSAIKTSEPINGIIEFNNNGSFVYTPNNNWYGTDYFTYKAFDGRQYSNETLVTITVSSINDPPTAVNDTATTSMNDDVWIDILDNDFDVDGFIVDETISIVSDVNHGNTIVNTSTGEIWYNPEENFYGIDYFSYIVNDNDNSTSNEAHVTINILDGETIDINQSIYGRGFAIRHASDGDWGGAQNFVPTINVLTKVELYVRLFGTPSFDLVVELREDSPDGTLIDSKSFSPGEVSVTYDWLEVDFTDVSVDSGTHYFLVCPSPSGVSDSFGYEWGYIDSDQYTNGSFWFTRNGGGNWQPITDWDFTFRTYGYS